jgi:hypothetical protein
MKQFCRTIVNRSTMRQAAVIVFMVACLAFASAAVAQNTAVRSVEGKVYDAQSAVVSGAVVYLQDGKTNDIKTFISTQDGSYRFGQLSMDVDYLIWADLKGKKSDKKTISSFNSKKQLVIDLHLKD